MNRHLENAVASLLSESDRGLLLVGSALLEEVLLEALIAASAENRLAKKQLREQVFGQSGPLASFSAKIRVSYAFGVISIEQRRDLDRIRKIRNDAAHGLFDLDFEEPPWREKIDALELGKELRLASGRKGHSTRRSKLLDTIVLLVSMIEPSAPATK